MQFSIRELTILLRKEIDATLLLTISNYEWKIAGEFIFFLF